MRGPEPHLIAASLSRLDGGCFVKATYSQPGKPMLDQVKFSFHGIHQRIDPGVESLKLVKALFNAVQIPADKCGKAGLKCVGTPLVIVVSVGSL